MKGHSVSVHHIKSSDLLLMEFILLLVVVPPASSLCRFLRHNVLVLLFVVSGKRKVYKSALFQSCCTQIWGSVGITLVNSTHGFQQHITTTNSCFNRRSPHQSSIARVQDSIIYSNGRQLHLVYRIRACFTFVSFLLVYSATQGRVRKGCDGVTAYSVKFQLYSQSYTIVTKCV